MMEEESASAEMEILKARIAALEATPTDNRFSVAITSKWKSNLKRIVIYAALAVAALFFYAILFGPHTIGDYAKLYTRECIRNNGDGDWQGSSGVSLEKFCEGVGNYKALLEDKKEHPESY